ncbi:MAG TPA: NADH-quinone oxidoreductase subunit L [Nitrososphaerales archaeon]|nr:NADH-quinone oxidoreductase subunit L [Nitrososphaerales archaeon]
MLAAWLIWIVPLAGAPLVPLAGLVDEKACRWFAVAVSGAAAGIGLYQAVTFSQPYVEGLGGWSIFRGVQAQVQVDGLSVLLSAFVSVLSFIIVVYAAGNMEGERGQARFYSLVLVFVGGMLGLVMAGNLLQLYLFWEIVGVCSALLIAFWTDREAARRAGLKAFAVTRIGDVSLLIAVVLTLTSLGTTSFSAVNSAVSTGSLNWLLVGFLLLVGAMAKSAQFPLHVWLPDAMEGPTPVSALIHAATMVNAGVYLVVRMDPVFASYSLLTSSLLVVGLASLVLGAACAFVAEDLKRILAYSTISQLGLMFAAVGLGSQSGAVYQLISQGLFKALAFMAAGSVIEAVASRSLRDMGGLARKMKYTYFAFLVAVLAMVGVPPLIGFWTKDEILSAAVSAGGWTLAIVVLGSTLTAFYSFRALAKVFHGAAGPHEAKESGPLMVGSMVVLALLVVVGWVGLGSQAIFVPALSEAVSLVASSTTVAVALLGLAVCYLAYLSGPDYAAMMMQTSSAFKAINDFFLDGLGIDRLYSHLATSVLGGLSRVVSGIQSGDLDNNVALLLATVVVLVVLAASGVI